MKLAQLKAALASKKRNSTEGVWVFVPTFGFKLKLARAGQENGPYQRALEAGMEPYRDRKTGLLNRSAVPAEATETILREIFPLHVVLDWDLQDDEGKAVPYDAKLMREFMADPDLFTAVVSESASAEVFFDKGAEADLGN